MSSLRVNKFVFSRSEDFSTKNSCSFHNSTFQQLQSSELQMRTIIRKFNVKHFSVAGDRVRQHTWKQVGDNEQYISGIFDIFAAVTNMCYFWHIWYTELCFFSSFSFALQWDRSGQGTSSEVHPQRGASIHPTIFYHWAPPYRIFITSGLTSSKTHGLSVMRCYLISCQLAVQRQLAH